MPGTRLEENLCPGGVEIPMVTVRAQRFEIPFERAGALGRFSEIPRVGSSKSQHAQIGGALEFGRQCRRLKWAPRGDLQCRRLPKSRLTMARAISLVHCLVRIGRDGRPSVLHG